MAFARWDPLRDLLAIQQRLDRYKPAPDGWVPVIDVFETATDYVLTAELPGLRQQDVAIQAQESMVTLAGSRPETQQPCEQFHRVERGHGSFRRTFQLPNRIDPQHITAELRDGVLTVTCPKAAEPEARRIHIS
jgi:HSP20 family protein